MESVDLYLIHTPLGGGKEARLAQYRALVECQRLGLATSIGVSNYGIAHLQEIEDAGLPLPAANQLEIHPMCQKPELLAFMAGKGIPAIAYSSLAPLSNWREGQQSAKPAASRAAASPFAAMAAAHGFSEAQVLLRWALQRGFAVLPKSTRRARMAENADLFSGAPLSGNEMAAIAAMDQGAPLAFGSEDSPLDPTAAP